MIELVLAATQLLDTLLDWHWMGEQALRSLPILYCCVLPCRGRAPLARWAGQQSR